MVEGRDAIPVVRVHRRLAGLALRHDGPAALQPRPDLGGPQPAPRSARRYQAGCGRRLVRRNRDDDLHDRLGPGRVLLRSAGRQDRPRKDDAADRPVLFGVHGVERVFDGRLGLRRLSLPDGPGRGRAVCRRRRSGRRGHVGPRPAVCARVAAGAFGRRQHARGVHESRSWPARGERHHLQLVADHVPDRPAAGPAGDPDLPAAEGARALEGGGAARKSCPGRERPSSARWPNFSATPAGGGTRSSA